MPFQPGGFYSETLAQADLDEHYLLPWKQGLQGTLDVGLIDSVCASDSPDR